MTDPTEIGPGVIARRNDPDYLIRDRCPYCGSRDRALPATVDRRHPDHPYPDPKARMWECRGCAMPWLRIERIHPAPQPGKRKNG